jgi:hypothetical protein
MAVQAINPIQPLRVSQVKNDNDSNNIPKYRLAYIPNEFYDKYCSNDYCPGRYLSYLA